MPKTNHAGATYFGHEGVVENAVGELSQLHPSRNLDGSVVDGYESEDQDLADREEANPQADPTGVRLSEDVEAERDEAEPDEKQEPTVSAQEKHEEPEGRAASKRGTPASPTDQLKSTRSSRRTTTLP